MMMSHGQKPHSASKCATAHSEKVWGATPPFPSFKALVYVHCLSSVSYFSSAVSGIILWWAESEWGHSGGTWQVGGVKTRLRLGGGVSVLWVVLRGEVLLQPPHLLLPLAYELVQVALSYQQGGFDADVTLVVVQLRAVQVTGQNILNHSLAPVQVFLQLTSVFLLTAQLLPLQLQRFLQGHTQTHIKILFIERK